MEYQDYYKTLNVEKTANADDIKKNYRRLARKYHPDVSDEKDAEDKFKQVQEAYSVLKDTEKRAAYDQLGQAAPAGDGFTPPPGWEYQASGNDPHSHHAGDYSDFFESIFGQHGQGSHSRMQQQGQDQHTKINISLEEAYRGCERSLTLQQQSIDPRTGQVQNKKRQLNIKIPAGVTQGQQIRLAKQGGSGTNGGANGNLYLEVQLTPHPHYTVDKKDIYLNLPITPWEAALGDTIEVPTLAGKVSLKIPAGSQTGKKLRLKNRGLPGKNAGNQYVLLNICTPAADTPERQKLYQQMAQNMPFNPREELMTRSAS